MSEAKPSSSLLIPRESLLGFWPLIADVRDHSGRGHHGIRHGVAGASDQFDGRSNHIEVAFDGGLDLGTDDFTFAAWVRANDPSRGMTGDIINQWDASRRRGFTLAITGSAGGYNSHGSERHIHFGTDDGQPASWEDCGRPNPTSNYVSNSLTVFNGGLYAATTDAKSPHDWAHVYRYLGGQDWQDCGRVGDRKARGVGPMIVHGSQLYAATWSYDWTRVLDDDLDACHVYRYAGGTTWEDCGQPGECRRLFSIASFAGKLYVAGDDAKLHVYEGGQRWAPVRTFRNFVHPMAVHDGKLFVGEFGSAGEGTTFRPTEVHAFDGGNWSSAGCPLLDDGEDQLHAFHVHHGLLHVTTWPHGKVAALQHDGTWRDCGRLGESTEANALVVHNGSLYSGTIPRAEVYRHDGDTQWSRVGRFCPDDVAATEEGDTWGRVTSLTSYAGRLFASGGSYTSSIEDSPADQRGRVYALRAGPSVSYDHDIGGDWRHITAQRRSGRLELHLDGKRCASDDAPATASNLTCTAPLRIGFGPVDHFSGAIRNVGLWQRALTSAEISRLASQPYSAEFSA